MRVYYPPEMLELRKKFEPYLEGCHLCEDAPKEVVEAYEEYYKWFEEELGMEQ